MMPTVETRSRVRTGLRAATAIAVVFALVASLAACAAPPAPTTKGVRAAGEHGAAAQTCAACNGKGAAPKTSASAVLENGVQVVEIGVRSGYYAPNAFTVQAGVPTRVVFRGSAMGCLAKPVFPKLGKKADFSNGKATVDLGSLAPGTYAFTCAMGMNAGTIVAR